MADTLTFFNNTRSQTLAFANDLTKLANNLEKHSKRSDDTEALRLASKKCYQIVALLCKTHQEYERKLASLISFAIQKSKSALNPRRNERSLLASSGVSKKSNKKPGGPSVRRRTTRAAKASKQ